MDGMILKRGSDSGKLKTIDEHYVATNGQTVFPIAYETFDYKKDTVFVTSGRTTLSEGLDYSVVGNKITLVEGVPEGRTVTIRIMKNVNTDAEDKTMSGVYIEPRTMPLDRLAEEITPERIGAIRVDNALGLKNFAVHNTTTEDTIGWKVIGKITGYTRAMSTQLIRFYTSAYSEGAGWLFIALPSFAGIKKEGSAMLMYFGADLGTTAFSKFRLTADVTSGNHNGDMFIEAYLDDVTQPHNFQLADMVGGIELYDVLEDSVHPYTYAEVDIDNGGFFLSKPMRLKDSGITYGTESLTAGTSALTTDRIYLKYQ